MCDLIQNHALHGKKNPFQEVEESLMGLYVRPLSMYITGRIYLITLCNSTSICIVFFCDSVGFIPSLGLEIYQVQDGVWKFSYNQTSRFWDCQWSNWLLICIYIYSSYSSWPISVSWRRAHIRAVMFLTVQRVQRDTRLCPYLVWFATLYPLMLSHLRRNSVLIPCPFSPPSHPRTPPLPPLPSPLILLGQFPPVPATTSPPWPLTSSPPPRIGPELVGSQYTAWPYTAFAKFRFPLAQTPHRLFPPSPRCTPIFCPSSNVEDAPSVAAPPGIGNPPVPVPWRG